VRAWLGVPFAAPPVRDLRWRAPQPVHTWDGIFQADRFAPMCLQPLRFRTMNHYFGTEATSEDCLYLNVWAPAAPAQKLPVIVWIYGGGFTVGSASMANYDGAALAATGVVRVNIAYRVGALGFFSHPDLTTEGNGASGNYGLMDQIAGLQWVKRNIAAFGGDPENVTIVGQSAGSMSVALLQSSPQAAGLFHKTVGMSGSPFGDTMTPVSLAQAESDGVRFQQALKADGVQSLRDIAGDRIISTPFARASAIVVDGAVLPDTPAQVFSQGAQNNVPVMLGYTRDESFLNLGPVKTVADYRAAVARTFPESPALVLKAYPVKTDADVARAVADVQRDASVGRQMANWARAQKAPAYAWFFTRRQPYAPGITFADHDPATVGAYHTGDVPYWFRTRQSLNLFRQTRAWEVVDATLEDAMSGMLLSFARTGVPSADWPAFDARRPRVMQLGEAMKVIDWPNYRSLDLLRTVPAPPPAPTGRIRD
jgi:para-nitrobenzyl esterase